MSWASEAAARWAGTGQRGSFSDFHGAIAAAVKEAARRVCNCRSDTSMPHKEFCASIKALAMLEDE